MRNPPAWAPRTAPTSSSPRHHRRLPRQPRARRSHRRSPLTRPHILARGGAFIATDRPAVCQWYPYEPSSPATIRHFRRWMRGWRTTTRLGRTSPARGRPLVERVPVRRPLGHPGRRCCGAVAAGCGGVPPGRPTPAGVSRRVNARGAISLGGFTYAVGASDAGEPVEAVVAGGLVDIVHAGVVIATHAQRFRADQADRAPRARDATTGLTVTRLANASGTVSFAGTDSRPAAAGPARPSTCPSWSGRCSYPGTAGSSGSTRSGTTGPASSARSPTPKDTPAARTPPPALSPSYRNPTCRPGTRT